MAKRTLAAALLIPGLLLAWLAPPVQAAVITHEEVHIQYTWEEFFGAADGKEFQVQIRGNPFAMADEAFHQAVLARLQQRSVGPATTWTVKPASEAAPDQYRLVLVFGAGSQLGQTLCADLPSLKPAPAKVPAGVQVAAAYCRGSQPMTEAYARTDSTGAEDRSFDRMFSELMPVLFPRRPGLRLDPPFWRRD
ncbi:MAG: hypothetical protein AB7R90_13240 [Reyranellaceae bacterium]